MGKITFSAAVLALAVSSKAATVEYITDLPLYSSLAPCAQSALEYNVQAQSSDKCPEDVTELQSCVCTKNNNFASISSRVSASISYSCGSTASDDHASVATVLSLYCDTNAAATFATPTAVTAYITEIPEFDYMAPCAKSALANAVGLMTYSLCPSEAPALASCVCSKNQNSRYVSQRINSSAKYSCDGHTADISSAQAMFSAYCAMNDGTTAFPVPSMPPGDMTYHITDLPQYSSLAPCAAYGVSYGVFSQTYDYCPGGPQALASCVCLKPGMPNEVSKVITASVKYSCASTATEDVSSAIAVYNYYCSAVQAQVTPAGVSNSIEQTFPATGSRNSDGPQATGGSGSDSGSGNGNGNGNGSGDGNGSSDSNGSLTGDSAQDGGDTSSSSGPNIGVIVGAVVGVVVGLALIGALVFFLVKSAKKRKAMEQLSSPNGSPPAGQPPVPAGPYSGTQELPNSAAGPYSGMQELHNTTAAGALSPPSPSPSNVPGRMDNVSPASAHTGAFAPPPNQAELHGNSQAALYPPMPNRPELHNQGVAPSSPSPVSPNASELYGQGTPPPNRPELQGQGAMYPTPPPDRSELQGQGTQFHHANPNRPELAGQYNYAPQQPQMQQQPYQGYQQGAAAGWQAGPVQGFHEMEGSGQGGGSR